MCEHQLEAARIVLDDPNVDAFMCRACAQGDRAANTGMIFMRLKPRDQWCCRPTRSFSSCARGWPRFRASRCTCRSRRPSAWAGS